MAATCHSHQRKGNLEEVGEGIMERSSPFPPKGGCPRQISLEGPIALLTESARETHSLPLEEGEDKHGREANGVPGQPPSSTQPNASYSSNGSYVCPGKQEKSCWAGEGILVIPPESSGVKVME